MGRGRQGAKRFVPKGPDEGSLARSAWNRCENNPVPLGYGVIGRAAH
jgi:hypothetical protein